MILEPEKGTWNLYNRSQNPDRLLSWELTLKLTTKWKKEQEENSMLILRQKWS